MVKNVEDKDFSSEISDGVSFVDLWAEWCGPCRMQSPVVEKAAEENDDVNFMKLDVDDNPETTNKYGVKAIPTMLVFKDGELKDTLVGYHDKDQINQVLDSVR